MARELKKKFQNKLKIKHRFFSVDPGSIRGEAGARVKYEEYKLKKKNSLVVNGSPSAVPCLVSTPTLISC